MFIAIEGCIGAGKTTVAKGLAAFRRSDTLFESFESNPFLPDFYQNPSAFATETEFTFLLLHFHQLKTRIGAGAPRELITDFHLGKDLLYAGLNLHSPRLERIFQDLYEALQEQLPKPDLLICLSAKTDLIIGRIGERQRDFELEINPDYYAKVNAEYEKLFAHYMGRKMMVSMDEWDFVKNPALFQTLSQSADKHLNLK